MRCAAPGSLRALSGPRALMCAAHGPIAEVQCTMSGMTRFASIGVAVIAMLGCAAACGGSQASAPGTTAAAAATKPAERPVPADPLALLVGNPSGVVDLRVDRLRGSQPFARVRTYLERAGCISGSELDAALATTQRALLAQRTSEQREQLFSVLSGRYTDQDAARLLEMAAQRDPEAAQAPAAPEMQGRFGYTRRGPLAVSLLEQRIILLGDAGWLRAALESIDKPGENFAMSKLWRELGPRAQCEARMICAFGAAGSSAGERIEGLLAGAGSRALGRDLREADSVLGISAPDDIEIELAAQMRSPEAATESAQRAKDLLWQAGLLTRLAGLPNVLGDARIAANGALLSLDLRVSASDLAAYEARLAKLLEGSGSDCAAPAAPVVQTS